MLRQGVLRVSREFLAIVDVEPALPPGHSVVATRDIPDSPWVDFLIEGPHMPEGVAGADPDLVMMIIRQEATGGRVTARFARWAHLPDFVEWPIPQAAAA